MAQMHPSELPVAVLADPARRAEVDAFKLLAQGLDASFHVFYRCSVAGMDLAVHKVADFIILHPQHGLLGVAIAEDTLPHSGTEQRLLPYSPIRSAVRSLIFGLKEQGIRFYIPAPCCVIFPYRNREDYAVAAKDMDYTPLFPSDYPDLQTKIMAMMPITAGYQSTWRVPDAVEKIAAFLQVNTPQMTRNKPEVVMPVLAPAVQPSAAVSQDRPRIVYVVRAIDIVLAFATIMALYMLVRFMPEGVADSILAALRGLLVPKS